MWKQTWIPIFIIIILLTGFGLTRGAPAGDTLVVKADKIYTAAGEPIEKAMIIIRNGKIVAVGTGLKIPEDADLMTAEVVVPGLVDIHSHLGVYSAPGYDANSDGNEMTEAVTPQVQALDSFNFHDPALRTAVAGGVTTIVSRPGSGNVIGGTSVAVKLKKAPPADMVLKPICDLKMTIEGNPVRFHGGKGRRPTSLMTVYELARKAFVDARAYGESWEEYRMKREEGGSDPPPLKDPGKEALTMALRREIPVHIHTSTAAEIMSCIRLADEFGLRLTLAHCELAYLIKDELAGRRDIHFNVGPAMFLNHYGHTLEIRNLPAQLAEAGLNVSLQIDAVSGRQPAQRHLLHTAALCVREGMRKQDALLAVTIRSAEAAGLEKRIGSLEPGKDADLVFLNGEPLDWLTQVELTMIDGQVEYRRVAQDRPILEPRIESARGRLDLPDGFEGQDEYVVRAGTIFTITGDVMRDGWLHVRNGKIEGLESGGKYPEDCPVIDAGPFVIIPGLIAARSHLGISSNWAGHDSTDETAAPVVPELEVKHAIEPQDPLFAQARRLGISTVRVTPGNVNPIGGQGLVIKTRGKVVDDMVLRERAAMMFSLGMEAKRAQRMPMTRMGIVSLIREHLTRARALARRRADPQSSHEEEAASARDDKLEALIPVIEGRMPAIFQCNRKDDIQTALRIADEFGLSLQLAGAVDAYKLAEELGERKVPVLLSGLFRGGGNQEDRDFCIRSPGLLSRAGVPVTLIPGDYLVWFLPRGLMGGDPLELAAFAFKHGMPAAQALRAVTIDAAEMLGVADRVGSLEPGKDADFVILRGHPLATGSVQEAVFIDGELVYKRSDKHP